MKKMLLPLLWLCLIYVSCSTDTEDNCPNWYYVYVLDDCSCENDDSACETYQIINEEIYICLQSALEASTEPCVYIDSDTCSGISFSGYIKEVIEDCLEIDLLGQ